MKFIKFSVIFSLLWVFSCVPFVEEPLRDVNIDFNDPVYKAISNYQDSQQLDSLFQFMRHRDPSYRYAIANAFASFHAPEAVDSLVVLLSDSIRKVQIAAAYALGQIGEQRVETALTNAFINQDTGTVNNVLNATILESIGKCGSEKMLELISTIQTYEKSDHLLLLGQARSLYRFGLRGMFHPKGSETMINILLDSEFPTDCRLVAANYLHRFNQGSIDENKFQLAKVFTQDENPFIRMALPQVLSKTGSHEILNTLTEQLKTDSHAGVKINILRSLGDFPYINVIQLILNTLSDRNVQLAKAASDYLLRHGVPSDAQYYVEYARKDLHWSVKTNVYKSILVHIPNQFVNTRSNLAREIRNQFIEAESAYEKSAYLNALAGDVNNYRMIRDLGLNHEDAVVRTSCIEGIGEILRSPKWKAVYRGRSQSRRVKTEIAGILQEAIESGDIGMISAASDLLADKTLDFKILNLDISYLTSVKNELQLPKENNAFSSINNAINTISDSTMVVSTSPGFNNPIDWNEFFEIKDSSRAVISTEKGDIVLRFYQNYSPGTIANFVHLAKSNFFDNKVFHRVISNFVIQGGCPRGDGYGSLDYTIRSELGPLYYDNEGYVGMASSGNHTESTQFFITMNPTMHLDGKYTIFARVVDGMDVVRQIQIGDSIKDVIIR